MPVYVVAYDISDSKRRRELSDLLEAEGMRVQNSLFEIYFKNGKELERLKRKIADIIDRDEDSVRLYAQCAECREKAIEMGDFCNPFERDAVYYF
jgi:CRISPR-associated protein Cas2